MSENLSLDRSQARALLSVVLQATKSWAGPGNKAILI